MKSEARATCRSFAYWEVEVGTLLGYSGTCAKGIQGRSFLSTVQDALNSDRGKCASSNISTHPFIRSINQGVLRLAHCRCPSSNPAPR